MSEENVELARRYFEAINAYGIGDRTEHLRHPEFEFFDPPNLPDAGRHVGETAIRELVQRRMEFGWDGKFHIQEYIDAGDEVVVVWQMRFGAPGGEGFHSRERSRLHAASRTGSCAEPGCLPGSENTGPRLRPSKPSGCGHRRRDSFFGGRPWLTR